jgi:hypothetical protein
MRQHRITALLVALAAALAVPATGATAPGDIVRGPGCGNITLWDTEQAGPPVYRGTEGGSATVGASLTTAKPSCSGFNYTISVYTDATQTTLIDSFTFAGDDSTSTFTYTYTFPSGAPRSVCIKAESTRDGRVIDAAPNSGCEVVVINSSGGQSGIG